MKRLLIILTLGFIGTSQVLWAIPSEINYQGTLKEKGLPATGNKNITFTLTSQDGQTAYSNAITVNTPVVNGLFSTKLNFQLLAGNTWESITPYIKVNVEGQDLSPTEKVSAAVYATLSASIVDNGVTNGKIADNAVSTSKIADGSITTGKLDPGVQVAFIPPGMLVPFAGPNVPPGWLLCDGSAVSRTTYSNLFVAIGVTWGPGDGAITFNLPDLRGRTPIGAGQGAGLSNRTLGSTFGEESHVLTVAEIPSHNHLVTDPGHGHNLLNGTTVITRWADVPGASTSQIAKGNGGGKEFPGISNSTTGISVDNTGGGGAHNNMPPSVVVNYIIKI